MEKLGNTMKTHHNVGQVYNLMINYSPITVHYRSSSEVLFEPICNRVTGYGALEKTGSFLGSLIDHAKKQHLILEPSGMKQKGCALILNIAYYRSSPLQSLSRLFLLVFCCRPVSTAVTIDRSFCAA